MGNRTFYKEEERELTIKVKIKTNSISNYYHMDKDRINSAIDEFFEELPTNIVHAFNSRNRNCSEELISCDRIFFDDLELIEVKPLEDELIDKVLDNNGKRFMKIWNLENFKSEYRSLYKVIKESIKQINNGKI